MAKKILLPLGCKMSTPSVNPKNWKSGGSSLLKEYWRIQYYFFDPDYKEKWPYGKLIVVKNMNEFKTLNERRQITNAILNEIINSNKKGYNPIKKRYSIVTSEISEFQELYSDMFFIDAFKVALSKQKYTESHTKQVRVAINRVEKAANKLGMIYTNIYDLKRRDMKVLLENCNLPNYYFNKYLSYFSPLFSELLEYECCDTNIIRDIRKKKVIKKQREVLSRERFNEVMLYLKNNYYEFWRYANIFVYSGARTTELMRLKVKDVNLENQEFNTIIEKGKVKKNVTKVILKEAIPLWQDVINEANKNDYLFSRGLKPGKKPIKPYQITLRWKNHVKNKLNVKADFYALKHAFLDTLDEDVAQKIASHTNLRTTAIYRINQDKRDREALKEIDVKLKVV